MPYKIINNGKKYEAEVEDVLDLAMERMAKDIITIGSIRVPFKSSDLQKSAKHERKKKLSHRVIYDEDYASFQEKGERADGTHKVRKYSTPGTDKGFLEGAAGQVTKDAMEYIKQANNLINL